MKYMAMVGSEIFWNGIAFGRIGRAERVSDVQVCNTGNCNDGADTRLADFYFIQTVKLVKLADLYALGGCRDRDG